MQPVQSANLKTQSGNHVAFEGMDLSGDIHGSLLNMWVTQHFINSERRHVEIIYTFPLPWAAILLEVEVLLGDKVLTGLVVEKGRAEKEYEDALTDGDTAIMLEKNKDHSYSLSLGNIAPQERCQIRFKYAQCMKFDQGGARLLIPTVIAPQYRGSVLHNSMRSTVPLHLRPTSATDVEYPFTIQLRVHGDLAQARISSPTHTVATELLDQQVLVSLMSSAPMDRDFILTLDQLRRESSVVMAPDLRKPEHYAVMASFCTELKKSASQHVKLHLLVDCSGSMAGDSIASTRSALRAILDSFEGEDQFLLSRFGSEVEHRSRAMWKINARSKLAAQRWANGLDADLGGTEMAHALMSTIALSNSPRSDVLMITDGEISDIESVIETAQKSGHRIFIVGIGSAPAESHLRRIALATGGACEFVAPGEAVERAILRMFARLRSPRLKHVKLVWPEGCEPVWVSNVDKNLFDRDNVNVFALLPQKCEGVLRIEVQHEDAEMSELAALVSLDGAQVNETSLSRVVANARILNLEPLFDHVRAQELAVDYQLITNQTNFILVRRRDEENKSNEMPPLHQVKQMLAAGWGGTSTVTPGRSKAPDFIPLGKPACFRRSIQTRDTASQMNDLAMDAFNIPFFLRVDPSKKKPPQITAPRLSSNRELLAALLDRTNQYFWMRCDGQQTLTPVGLVAWLKLMNPVSWPKTYQGLREIGINSDVTDWLELSISNEYAESTEAVIVASFLWAMSDNNLAEDLFSQIGKSFNLSDLFSRLRGKFVNTNPKLDSSKIDENLVKTFGDALRDIQSHEWPSLEMESSA
nr:VIT and VWA domain-containing protein [uncultured Undibacterium sp.]